jgi:type II secretory pathway pseudopilin PulG
MEMLVVIAIIGSMFALLIPVYHKVTESAKVSKDLSNLRQIGSAVLLYANDAGFIPGEQWPALLEPNYLPDLRVCQSPFDSRRRNADETAPISYDVNSNIWGVSPLLIVSPSDCILAAPLTADAPVLRFLSTSMEPGLSVPLSMESNGGDNTGGTCANGTRIPVVYADGHAAVISMTTFHSVQPNPLASAEVRDIRWNR